MQRRLFLSATASAATLARWRTGLAGRLLGRASRSVSWLAFRPGGLTDGLARAYGEYMATRLGQPVIVDNRSGAAGMLAGGEVARAAPDGHTLWFTLSSTLAQNRVLFKKLPYDPDKDFVYVAGFSAGPLPMAVPLASPVKTFSDLLALGRKQRITLGNYAAGSYPQMLAEHMTSRMGAEVEPVPYKGEAPMWLDVVSGQLTAGQGRCWRDAAPAICTRASHRGEHARPLAAAA